MAVFTNATATFYRAGDGFGAGAGLEVVEHQVGGRVLIGNGHLGLVHGRNCTGRGRARGNA